MKPEIPKSKKKRSNKMKTNKKTERVLEDVQIKLSALWAALMLTYFLGCVMRILAGDFIVGEIGGIQSTPIMWLGLAMLMVVPVVMVFLSLTCSWSRWANIISAIIFFGLNLMGLLGYTSAYDTFLNIVGLVFNVLIFRYAWRWSKQEA
jgi:magnesium-transporting ATPase (P-type)